MNIEDDIARLRASGISRTKAAQALGLQKWQLDAMLEVLEIEWKPRIRGGTYVIDGVTDTLDGHAQALGVAPTTLRQRLQAGNDLTAPPANTPVSSEEAHAFAELRKAGVAAWDAAKQIGRPYNTLKNAAKKYVKDYDNIIATAPRIRRSPEEIEQAA
jgi:lambda repressor-like predicted transcriptional regulator